MAENHIKKGTQWTNLHPIHQCHLFIKTNFINIFDQNHRHRHLNVRFFDEIISPGSQKDTPDFNQLGSPRFSDPAAMIQTSTRNITANKNSPKIIGTPQTNNPKTEPAQNPIIPVYKIHTTGTIPRPQHKPTKHTKG
jgi:hypothetical protein